MMKKFKRFMAIVLSISLFTTSTLYASNEDTTATFEEPDVQIELPLDDSDVTVQDDTQLPSDVEEEVQLDENQEDEQITEDEESESDLESSDEEYAEEYSVIFHKPSVGGGFVTAWSEGEASAAVIYGADDTYTVDVTNGATLNFAIVANENFAIEEVTTQDGTIIEADSFAEDAAIYKMEVTADTEITTVFTDLLAEEELEEVLKEEVENAQYTVSVVHILNTAIGKFRQGNELQLSNADFEVDSYDVLQHAVEKQGIALTTGTATLTTESFDENGNATVVVEYEIAQGWRAVSNYNVRTRSLYQGTFDDVTIVPVGQFPVTIAFNYENGIVAAPTVTIMADENKEAQEFSFDYRITEKEGYDIQISNAAGFELSENQLIGTFSNTMTSAFVNVTYVAKDATYKIVTRQQTVADLNEFEEIGEVTVNGRVGEVTEATSTEIADFVAQPITQKEIAADNSTVVYVDYVRNTYRITFNTAGGSYKSPVVGVYQQTVTVYTDADTPTKAGAKFEGWYLDDQFETKAPTTTVLSGDITVYAKWTAGTASYRIAYFREVWSAEGNYYVYTGDYETITGTVGTTVTGSDSKSTYYQTGKDSGLKNAAYRYHAYAGSDTAVVKADGSTVVAVYYDLKQYTITFHAKTSGDKNTNAVININGTSAKSYVMTAVVGQDISNMYPDASKITGYLGINKPYAWDSDDDELNWISKRIILSEDMVTASEENFATTEFTCYAVYDYTKTVTVNYWLQSPNEPGTYVKDALISQTLRIKHNGFLSPKDIFGYTYEDKVPRGYPMSSGNTYHFYYDVNKGSISFFDGATELKTVRSIAYGADISGQNYTPAQPTGERSDYVFAGWYDNASLLGITPYNFKTMPDGVLQLFAKWVAPEKEVTLIYNYDNKEEIIKVEKGSPLTMSDPERDGYVFGGWYTDESLQTAFDAAAPITKEVTLYARWIEAKATTYTVRYVVADATTESGYRDIKDSKIVSAISGTVVTEKALKIEGYEGYIVNRPVQTLELTTSAANNVITFVYSQQSEIEYKVQYRYNGAVISSTDWIKSAANVFNVYPKQEEVTKLMKLGYELKQSFVICNFGTDRENNIATFELGLWNFGITYTGLEGVTAWLGSTGAANPNPATYTVEDTFSLFNPSKPNHTFTGWKLVEGTNPDGTHSSMNTTISAGTTGKLEFEATWAEDTVTISYEVDQNNTQAGTVSRTSDTVMATTGDLTGTLSVASANDGYEFTGWYLGNSDTLVSADAELTAEKVNEYAKQNDAYVATTFTAKFSPDPEPETPVTPDPTPVTPDPTPVTPDPTPVTPDPTPVTPDPTPVTPDPTPVTPDPTPVTPDPTPVTPDPTPVTPDTTPEVTVPETPVTPVVVLDTTPVVQTPATQTVPEVTVPGDDGDYSLTPVEDTETPLANVDRDGAFCILHLLLMLAALVVLLFYTNSMKKRQRILFELEEKAKLRMLGKVVD